MFEEKLDALVRALSEWIEDRKGEMRTWESREREATTFKAKNLKSCLGS